MQDDVVARALEGNSRLVSGKYVPFARIGHGGMAEVSLALGRGPGGFNKLAVIKRLRNTGDAASLEMFLDEARLSARLSHPNIVNTYEVGEADGQYFLAMEYLEGQPLQAILAHEAIRDKPFDERAASFIAIQALKGLHYAHELADYDGTPLAIVHRDVSPQNLFLTYQGEVKLLDFGIAKATVNFTHTETGVFKGKVRYMAPEQIGEKHIDRRADVFSLGVVLWEMLAGRALYSGRADVASIVTRITGSEPPLIRTLRPDVSIELEAIVAKALRRDRSARYATADEMRLDLDRALRGQQEETGAALARMLNETFAETRDGVRARVRTFIADLPAVTGSANMPTLSQAPELDPLASTTGGRADSSASGLSPSSFSASALSASGLTGQSKASSLASPILRSSGPSQPPSARRIWPLATVGVAAVVAIGVAALRETRGPAPSAEVRAPPAGGAVAAASPGAIATVAARSSVHLETSPPGSLVEWNGQTLARTPADLAVPAGPQGFTISHEGYEPVEVTIDVDLQSPTSRAIVLRPKSEPPTRAAAPRGRHPSQWWPRPKKQASPPPAAPSSEQRAKIRVIDDNSPAGATAAATAPIASPANSAPQRKIRIVDNGVP